MSFEDDPYRLMVLDTLDEDQWERVLQLWNEGFPARIQVASVELLRQKVTTGHSRHYVALNYKEIVGWLGVFDRYATRWFSILVSQETQGQRVGSNLLALASKHEPCMFGWMVSDNSLLRKDGNSYVSPRNFYKKNGFRFYENCRPKQGDLPVILIGYPSHFPPPTAQDIICS